MNFTRHDYETILYSLEGYIQGNDDDKLCDELVGICDKIIEELAPVGAYADNDNSPVIINLPEGTNLSKVTITDDDYADKVDTLVGNMVASDDNVFTHDSEGC